MSCNTSSVPSLAPSSDSALLRSTSEGAFAESPKHPEWKITTAHSQTRTAHVYICEHDRLYDGYDPVDSK